MQLRSFVALVAISLSLGLGASSCTNNKPFEGKVTYRLRVPSMDSAPNSQEAMMMKMMMPDSIVIYSKDTLSRTEMKGGTVGGMLPAIVTLGSRKNSFIVDDKSKEVHPMPDGMMGVDTAKSTVKATGKSEKVLGYDCKEYTVTRPMANGTTQTLKMYATTSLGAGNKTDGPFSDIVADKQIPGVVLKTTFEQGGTPMVMEAIRVSNTPLTAGLFQKPKTYTETPFRNPMAPPEGAPQGGPEGGAMEQGLEGDPNMQNDESMPQGQPAPPPVK